MPIEAAKPRQTKREMLGEKGKKILSPHQVPPFIFLNVRRVWYEDSFRYE